MNRILQSPGTVVLAGGLMFFLTIFGTLKTVHFGPVQLPGAEALAADDNPSWRFRNPEFDQWVAQIKEERAAIAVREEELKEWETRLAAENREVSTVTQTVTKLQSDFDKRVLLFKDQEMANAKKQVKVVADMSPEGAAAMFNSMPDDAVTQLLFLMKPDVSGPILDAMSKLGDFQARRAAALTERLKDVLPMSSTNNLTSNANP
jgi:flagellar motility protein MotE (MotC chaperone)